ncbi:Peroxin-3-domain-containing protein [Syncephalis pseudoplumigaleata]|uniref:Peroxin-3-domain-containing protein n=1 Tax=Syncephalis pseudoplumigaleata TaxID=1712513 RepID=A0A4P9Z159_9FUNG|nr:Peroxin-3-domain-containing protein [Syncephalis pseudoplumigaleata]|eukprot:RKP26058.1 Peroxin-3-domain-containing protein [Syncephalis pseudoplumigaleata]
MCACPCHSIALLFLVFSCFVMLQPLWEFTKRHQRGLLVTAGIVGGAYATSRYIRDKWASFQRNSAEAMARRTDLKRRFEQNQTDCLFTVMALLPSLAEQLDSELDVDGITVRLRQNRQTAASSSSSGFVAVDQAKHREGGASEEKKEAGEKEEEAAPGSAGMANGSAASSDSGGQEIAAASFIEENTIDSPVELHPLDRLTKLELWQELKIRSFTRTMAATYLITLLTMLTHLQLNIVGRYIYVASVAESGVEAIREAEASVRGRLQRNEAMLAANTERDYLSFSWWLLHVGWHTCIRRVRNAVAEVISNTPLKKACSYEDLCDMINQMRRRVENPASTSGGETSSILDGIRTMLLPDEDEDVLCVLQEAGVADGAAATTSAISPELHRLLDETRDFIDRWVRGCCMRRGGGRPAYMIAGSPDFATVLAQCFDEAFGMLLHRLQLAQFPDPLPQLQLASTGIHELTPSEEAAMTKRVPLVKLLPDISRQVHDILNGTPNIYLKAQCNTPLAISAC